MAVVFAGCTGGMGAMLLHKLLAQSSSVLRAPMTHLLLIDYFPNVEARQALLETVRSKLAASPSSSCQVDALHWDAASLDNTVKLSQSIDAVLQQWKVSTVAALLVTTGLGFHGDLKDLTVAQSGAALQRMISVNAVGPSLLVQHCVVRWMPRSASSPSPIVLVVSSYSGLMGLPHRAAYCSSKFALNGYVESIAADFGHIKYILICPTSVSTPFRSNWQAQQQKQGPSKNEAKALSSSSPTGGATAAPPPPSVNDAQMTPEQCVTEIWGALRGGRTQTALINFVVLPKGKAEIAAIGIHLPWVHDAIRRKAMASASSKL